MTNTALISQQLHEFKAQVDHSNDDKAAYANYLLCKQHLSTLKSIRIRLVESKKDEKVNDLLEQYANSIEQVQLPSILLLESTLVTDKKKRNQRLSVDLHAVGLEPVDELVGSSAVEDDENLTQLKQRLTDGRSHTTKRQLSMDEELHEEEAKQDDILKDMLQFVQGLKEGANAFNDKLNEEKDILKAAEAGLQVTHKKINKSTKNLAKTINELSLFTALKIFALVILLFLFSIIVISILPKL